MEKDYNKMEFKNVKKNISYSGETNKQTNKKQTKTENLLSMLYFTHQFLVYGGNREKRDA